MAVHDAAVHFNIGNLATLLIYDKLGIERVYYTTTGCLEHDNQQVKRVWDSLCLFFILFWCSQIIKVG